MSRALFGQLMTSAPIQVCSHTWVIWENAEGLQCGSFGRRKYCMYCVLCGEGSCGLGGGEALSCNPVTWNGALSCNMEWGLPLQTCLDITRTMASFLQLAGVHYLGYLLRTNMYTHMHNVH